jgi:hypothetical protein
MQASRAWLELQIPARTNAYMMLGVSRSTGTFTISWHPVVFSQIPFTKHLLPFHYLNQVESLHQKAVAQASQDVVMVNDGSVLSGCGSKLSASAMHHPRQDTMVPKDSPTYPPIDGDSPTKSSSASDAECGYATAARAYQTEMYEESLKRNIIVAVSIVARYQTFTTKKK